MQNTQKIKQQQQRTAITYNINHLTCSQFSFSNIYTQTKLNTQYYVKGRKHIKWQPFESVNIKKKRQQVQTKTIIKKNQ